MDCFMNPRPTVRERMCNFKESLIKLLFSRPLNSTSLAFSASSGRMGCLKKWGGNQLAGIICISLKRSFGEVGVFYFHFNFINNS